MCSPLKAGVLGLDLSGDALLSGDLRFLTLCDSDDHCNVGDEDGLPFRPFLVGLPCINAYGSVAFMGPCLGVDGDAIRRNPSRLGPDIFSISCVTELTENCMVLIFKFYALVS